MSTTIGQQLRRAREARALTIDQAASATRIRAHYLRAIESGEFEALPSMVHARGFLRAYADFLGLDSEPLVSELDGKAAPEPGPPQAKPGPQPVPGPALKIQEEASAIFQGVGAALQRRRELLGLSLDDVERHTHLRQHYLRALEAGDLGGLPSPVQGRGMLDNYASFLGLDPEPLMLRFADGLQAQLVARQAVQPETRPRPIPIRENLRPPSLLKRLFSADILIGGSIAVFLVAFLFWGIIRIFAVTADEQPSPTAPSIAEVLLATSTPTETPTPLPATPTSPSQAQLFPTLPIATGTLVEGAPPGGGAAVQVYLTVHQRAWMRVTVDGKVQFDGRVLPGSAYPFIGDSKVEVLTGDGAALQIFYNGSDLGLMGDLGQIVDQVYTPQGALEPTATVTSTPSATQPPGTSAAETLAVTTPSPPAQVPAAPAAP